MSETQQIGLFTGDSDENTFLSVSLRDAELPLWVRPVESGDQLTLKSGGHQLVRRIQIDQKVPNSQRASDLVVVTQENEILALVNRKNAWREADQNATYYQLKLKKTWRNVMDNDIERVLYSVQDIQEACKRLGTQMAEEYKDKNPLIVGVLKGAALFMTDVIRQMDISAELDFIDVSSYHGGTESSGEVKLEHDLSIDVAGRDIIIVEDIIDSGRSLKFMLDLLKERHVNSIKVCTLLDKPSGRVVEAKADYVGFIVPNEFVVGYGLDYRNQYRNLPYVGVLKPAIYENK